MAMKPFPANNDMPETEIATKIDEDEQLGLSLGSEQTA